MKKIINGKMYDTDTATRIAAVTNGLTEYDGRYTFDELYRKKNGEFFLFSEGGPLSGYAKHIPNGRTTGRFITPQSEGEAKDWVEKHCSADTYLAIWPDVTE